MNAKVKEFVLTNKKGNVIWKIDGIIFNGAEFIPNDLLEKHVFTWMVNWSEEIIEITTEYHE